MDLSVVIVNWNTRDLLRLAVSSLPGGCAGLEHEVLVVDNASEDGSGEMIRKEFPAVQLIPNRENLGLTRAANQALKTARGQFTLCLNSDARLKAQAGFALCRFMKTHPAAGVVAPRVLQENGSLQPTAYPPLSLARDLFCSLHLYALLPAPLYRNWLLGSFFAHNRALPVGRVSGACWMIRRSALEAVGFLDESFWDGSAHDFCLRAWKGGWQVWFTPEAEVTHLKGVSVRKKWDPVQAQVHVLEETKRLLLKHKSQGWFRVYCLIRFLGFILSDLKCLFQPASQEAGVERNWLKGQCLGPHRSAP